MSTNRGCDVTFRLLVCLMAVTVSACGSKEKDCASLEAGDPRDYCWFDRAAKDAERNDLAAARQSLLEISNLSIKAMATEKVIFAAPDGLDQATVRDLCGQLPQPNSASCLRTYNRPHLWEK